VFEVKFVALKELPVTRPDSYVPISEVFQETIYSFVNDPSITGFNRRVIVEVVERAIVGTAAFSGTK